MRTPFIQAPAPAFVTALGLLCACSGEPAAPDARPAASAALEGPAELLALDRAALEARYDARRRRVAAAEATAEGVRLRVELGRLARALALVTGDDATWLARAEEHFTEAARRAALPGACGAGLELVELLARDRHDARGAYREAYRLRARFRAPSDGACVERALAVLTTLQGYAPPPSELAAIDADPDARDPSAPQRTAVQGVAPTLARWARANAGPEGAPASLIALRTAGAEPGSSSVRVVAVLDRIVRFEAHEVPADGAAPRRFYVDLEGTAPGVGVPSALAVGAAGVTRVRIGSPVEGATRIVLDLEEGTSVRLFALADPFRLVLDAEPAAPAEPRPHARPVRVIVIDPGHGGFDFGARYEGLTEAILTLDIALRAERALAPLVPGVRILFTRRTNEQITLEQRVAFANAVEADLFVSIHLNADDELVTHGGVATFVLDTTNDAQAIRLAARENGARASDVGGLEVLLAGLAREGQLAESLRLADFVQRETLRGGRRILPDLPDRGVKRAMFYVLVGARMPAVLLEASFLTHRVEHRALGTEAYRQALAEGIARGVAGYVAERASGAR